MCRFIPRTFALMQSGATTLERLVPPHHEFEGFVMAWELGSVKVTKRR